MIDGRTETEIEFPCPFCRKIIAVKSRAFNFVSADYGEKSGHLWIPIDELDEEFLDIKAKERNDRRKD